MWQENKSIAKNKNKKTKQKNVYSEDDNKPFGSLNLESEEMLNIYSY